MNVTSLVLGIEVLLPSFGSVMNTWPGLLAQSLVGLALLLYALTARTKAAPSQPAPRPSSGTYATLVMLGVTVTAMELPTAIPYFAAIALISEARAPLQVWAPLLGLYNVIFLLPPIALLLGHVALQQRSAGPYAALRRRLEAGARETMLWIAGLVGGAIFVTSAIELLVRLR